MRRPALLVTTAAFVLTAAACSSGEPAKNADGTMAKSAVESEMAQANNMRPGQYQATMQITKFEMPGMPPEALAQMRDQMQSATAVQNSYCLSDEEARAGRQDMMKRLSNAQGDCNFQNFDVSGNDVSGRMVCSGMPGGGSMTMTMTGTMTADTSDMTMASEISNPSVPQANANMTFHITARRTGDCSAAAPTTPATGAR